MVGDIILFEKKKDCCGCGACCNICPAQAISMEADEDGFLYPCIDENKCVKCRLCQKVCNYQHGGEGKKVQSVWAAAAADETLLKKSASGGAFAAVAEHVIRRGGVVFGCSMEQKDGVFFPEHVMVREKEDLEKLQGSKYVQSDMGNVYQQVREELMKDKFVFFSGTPCQVDALNGFLKNREYGNLLTADIVCHGVPGANFFRDFIFDLEKRLKGRITKIVFRDKEKGWGYYNVRIAYERGKRGKKKEKVFSAGGLSYYRLFLDAQICRENCYSCKYASDRRSGDLTFGDYWGIAEQHPDYLKQNGGSIDPSGGVSCILVNSVKGKRILEEMGGRLERKTSDFEKAAKRNEQLKKPVSQSPQREEIFKLYRSGGYPAVEAWYRKADGMKYYLRKIRDLLLHS